MGARRLPRGPQPAVGDRFGFLTGEQPNARAVGAADPLAVAVRSVWGRYLLGNGVELGPGHHPFPLTLPGSSVEYVDRWEPSENEALFPELGDSPGFPKPHHVANLDIDRLAILGDAEQDFVIASHVLEHVAEPIGLLGEIHRVLRPGGVLLILLPDRRRTFDRDRAPTSLAHLVAEFDAGVTEVDDEHIREFLAAESGLRLADVDANEELLELHRRRSIHVHCWTDEEFLPVLAYCVRRLDHRWELVDSIVADDAGPDGMEFGFVLVKRDVEVPGDVLADRLEQTGVLLNRRAAPRPTPRIAARASVPVRRLVARLLGARRLRRRDLPHPNLRSGMTSTPSRAANRRWARWR